MMLNRFSLAGLLLSFVLIVLQGSSCQSYQMVSSYPLSNQDHQIFRREHQKHEDDNNFAYPKMTSDLFGSNSDESSDRSRLHEDNESSVSSSDEVLEIPIGHSSQMVKRRKGPTLSVVNPLEILRQRLMLDLARRRIHENQQQIVANAQLLENIGKRSIRPSDEFQTLGDDKNYQP